MSVGLILAAGRGSRLGSLTNDRPKCLIEVGGKSLLSRQVASLRAGGVGPLAAVVGYRGEQIAACGLPVFNNTDWNRTGIFRSLSIAEGWLASETVMISYGDIFYSAETVRALEELQGDICITYDPHWWDLWVGRSVTPLDDAENFRLSEGGYLLEIGGRLAAKDQAQGQYMGLLKVTPRGWRQMLEAAKTCDFDTVDMTTILSSAIAAGAQISAVARIGAWGEVDTASDIALYERNGYV